MTKTLFTEAFMEIFKLTLSQMLNMFLLVLIGFILRKCKILPENASTTMSRLETYCFVPALYLHTQMTKCTVESFRQNYVLILYGFFSILAAILLAYPVSRLFVRNSRESAEASYQRDIYKYALAMGNHGFMGNFIILGVFGQDGLSEYLLFTFCLTIASSSWGLYVLVPKDEDSSIWQKLKKGLLTPPLIALVAGMILGLLDLGQYAPDFVTNALDSAGKCMGPLAMVLAGFVIGGYDLKELLTNKKVYAASALRLIVIPAVLMLVLHALGTPKEIMTPALIGFAVPLGLNTIVYPAAYGGETKTGASMTMISTTLSVITIPLMYLLFIVLL